MLTYQFDNGSETLRNHREHSYLVSLSLKVRNDTTLTAMTEQSEIIHFSLATLGVSQAFRQQQQTARIWYACHHRQPHSIVYLDHQPISQSLIKIILPDKLSSQCFKVAEHHRRVQCLFADKVVSQLPQSSAFSQRLWYSAVSHKLQIRKNSVSLVIYRADYSLVWLRPSYHDQPHDASVSVPQGTWRVRLSQNHRALR